MDLDRANGLTAEELAGCCASRTWVEWLLARRPYRSADDFWAAVDEAFAALAWADIEDALAGHPRLGERATGRSATEQAGVPPGALDAGNAAYESRFGHVYLARAAGRTAPELLTHLEQRLSNDPATEQQVVRAELREITLLRLEQLVGR